MWDTAAAKSSSELRVNNMKKEKKTDTGYVKYKLVLIMKTAQPQLSTLVPLTVPPS